MISISPSQNTGVACPSSASTIATNSIIVPRYFAARKPVSPPSSTPAINAAVASCAVAGRRSSTTSIAGRTCWKDWPKSPRTAAPRKCRYCVNSGWSRPSATRNSASCASLAPVGNSSSAGSPPRRVTKNTIVTMPHTAISASTTRVRR